MVILKKSLGFIVLLVLAFGASMAYRPWIYANNIQDFHLADSLPSFFSVIAIYAMNDLYYTIRKKPFNKIGELILITIVMLIYEFIQLFGWGFDIFDIIAILLGAIVTFIIYKPLKVNTKCQN